MEAKPKRVPPESLPRRRPSGGGFHPITIHVRVNRDGNYLLSHLPETGGPFRDFRDLQDAVRARYAGIYLSWHRRRRPLLPPPPSTLVNQGGTPSVEMAIEQALYWPDGRRKKRSKSRCNEQTGSKVRRLVQALVDNHNEDHNLLGDLAYELKDVVHYRPFCENRAWFYHLNFTMTKVAGDSSCGNGDNLFFAEVKCVRQEKQEEMLVSCFCMVRSTRNGLCYGCTNNGSVNMKHPNGADEYIGGHMDVGRGSPCGWHVEWSDSDDDVEAKKKELRRMFTGSDDPNVNTVLWMHPDDVLLEED